MERLMRYSNDRRAPAPNTANNDVGSAQCGEKTRSILLFAGMRIIDSQKYCVVCRDVSCNCPFSNIRGGFIMKQSYLPAMILILIFTGRCEVPAQWVQTNGPYGSRVLCF